MKIKEIFDFEVMRCKVAWKWGIVSAKYREINDQLSKYPALAYLPSFRKEALEVLEELAVLVPEIVYIGMMTDKDTEALTKLNAFGEEINRHIYNIKMCDC